MTRSQKHTPITGITTARSTKGYKALRSGKERAKQRNLLSRAVRGDDLAGDVAGGQLERWDEWACERDGKRYFDPLDLQCSKLMRK